MLTTELFQTDLIFHHLLPILNTLNDIPTETKVTAYPKSNIDSKFKPNMEKIE